MAKYILTQEAENDIKRIYLYGLEQFGLNQADAYYDLLFDCFDRIARNPLAFPAADHILPGYRFCVCGVDTVYYKIVPKNKVEIMTIIGRQDFP